MTAPQVSAVALPRVHRAAGRIAADTAPPGYVPIVPGAWGPGMDTRAAYGGGSDPAIMHVTTLAPAGPGSLRAALEASGPRAVVFDVSGTIDWTGESSNPAIADPYITVAGQTAPSPGILIRGRTLEVQTHDILLSHLRFRVGDASGGTPYGQRDCIRVLTGTQPYGIVLDHLSLSWSIDELFSSYDCYGMTLWRSLLAEPLHSPLHPDGAHSKTWLGGEETGLNKSAGPHGVAYIGTLMAHSDDRQHAQKSNTHVIAINDVVYGWTNSHAWAMWDNDGGLGPSFASFVGMVYKAGPSTPGGADGGKVYASTLDTASRVWAEDVILRGTAYPGGFGAYDLSEVAAWIQAGSRAGAIWHDSIPDAEILPANQVEAFVLANAGCRPTDRDAVDTRVINEVQAGTGGLKASVAAAGGWPVLAENSSAWSEPADPHGDAGGGYTNLEAALHADAAAVGA